MVEALAERVPRRRNLLQFVQFCIIGLTSFVIDAGISTVLQHHFGFGWLLARVISFSVAVLNGYIWNSIWTFRGMGAGKRHEQVIKFGAVNVVGLALNLAIMSVMFCIMTERFNIHIKPSRLQWWVAFIVATGTVSIWNFIANKLWTFAGVRTEY